MDASCCDCQFAEGQAAPRANAACVRMARFDHSVADLREALLPRFGACRKASAGVEFSFIVLPLFGLLIAILQIGVVFLAQQELETAVEKAARTLLTGQVQQNSVTQSQFATAVCANLTVLFSCPKVMIDLQTATAFSAANTSTPTLTYDANGNVTNNWQFQAGGAGTIMVLRVLYQFPVVVGPMRFNLSNLSNGARLLMSTAVFQVEPY